MKKLNTEKLMPQQLKPPKLVPALTDERMQRLTKLTARLVDKILDQETAVQIQPRSLPDEP
jgi:hypothetical protein